MNFKFVCFCGNSNYTEAMKLVDCYACGGKIHDVCFKYHIAENLKEHERLCADCHLKEIDPLYTPERALIGPYKNSGKKSFVVDASLRDKMRQDRSLQVQLRVFRVGTFKELNYPKYGMIKLNAKVLKTLTQPPENTSARKRKDFPLILTDSLKTGSNDIDVCISNDNDIYVTIVYLTKYRSPTAFCDMVKSTPCYTSNILKCYERLKKLNANDGEVRIMEKTRRFSLKDPISMRLIETPVRGEYCEHIDCFCLETWAIAQEHSNIWRWRCPICKRKSYKLVIDSLWIQILGQAEDVDQAMEVEFNEQSHYRVIDFKESNMGLGKLTATLNTINGIESTQTWLDPLEVFRAEGGSLQDNSNNNTQVVNQLFSKKENNSNNDEASNQINKMRITENEINADNNLKRKREGLNGFLEDYKTLKNKGGNKEEPIEL